VEAALARAEVGAAAAAAADRAALVSEQGDDVNEAAERVALIRRR